MGFSTDAIHAGQKPDFTTGAVVTPIYQTSTYAFEEFGKHKGYEYSRTQNFTREALEKNIAVLEKGKYGIAFASGLAAEHALMGLVKAGDHVVATDNVYGGTYRLYEQLMKDYGIQFTWVDTSNLKNISKAIKRNTKIVYIETPTNPMLTLTNLKGASEICRAKKIISVVDNTFMSPYFQNPLSLGCDAVLHSTTKYINGHSDVIGGIIVTSRDDIYQKVKYVQNAIGAVPSPFDCWLTLRSTKTLAVRMARHEENARALAFHLSKISLVKKVFYPGLPDHPQFGLAKKQMRGFGGMITIELSNPKQTKKFLNSVKIFTLAESLGGVESLVCHPDTMTHASVPKKLKQNMGLTENTIRLSVGIEDVDDLKNDIEQALG